MKRKKCSQAAIWCRCYRCYLIMVRFPQLLFYPPTTVTPFLNQVTINTDRRIGSGKSINPAFFYATILWENYLYLLDKFKRTHRLATQNQTANKVLDKQRQHTAMPKFAEQFIKDIWLMQPRLAQPRKKSAKAVWKPAFSGCLWLLMMREQVEAKTKRLPNNMARPLRWWWKHQRHGALVGVVSNPRRQTAATSDWWVWPWIGTFALCEYCQSDQFEDNSVAYQTSDAVHDNEAGMGSDLSHGQRRRERRRLPLAANSQIERELVQDTALSTKEHKPTQQQQLEKAQLQQLSLATHTNSAPAKSLIVAPITAQKDDDHPYQPTVSTSVSAYAETSARPNSSHPNNSNPNNSHLSLTQTRQSLFIGSECTCQTCDVPQLKLVDFGATPASRYRNIC